MGGGRAPGYRFHPPMANVTQSSSYRPIDCGLHDELQLRALRRAEVALRFRDAGDGHVRQRRAVLLDVRTEGGAEFLILNDGTRIRLDRLEEVDGIRFTRGC